jgi:hypothetical protein
VEKQFLEIEVTGRTMKYPEGGYIRDVLEGENLTEYNHEEYPAYFRDYNAVMSVSSKENVPTLCLIPTRPWELSTVDSWTYSSILKHLVQVCDKASSYLTRFNSIPISSSREQLGPAVKLLLPEWFHRLRNSAINFGRKTFWKNIKNSDFSDIRQLTDMLGNFPTKWFDDTSTTELIIGFLNSNNIQTIINQFRAKQVKKISEKSVTYVKNIAEMAKSSNVYRASIAFTNLDATKTITVYYINSLLLKNFKILSDNVLVVTDSGSYTTRTRPDVNGCQITNQGDNVCTGMNHRATKNEECAKSILNGARDLHTICDTITPPTNIFQIEKQCRQKKESWICSTQNDTEHDIICQNGKSVTIVKGNSQLYDCNPTKKMLLD